MLNVKAYKEELNNDEVRCEFVTCIKKDEFDGVMALMKAFGATVSISLVDDFKPLDNKTPEDTITNIPEMPDIATEVETVVNSTENYVNPTPEEEVKEENAVTLNAESETTETISDENNSEINNNEIDIPKAADSTDEAINDIPNDIEPSLNTVCYSYVPKNTRVQNADMLKPFAEAFEKNLLEKKIPYERIRGGIFKVQVTNEQAMELDATFNRRPL